MTTIDDDIATIEELLLRVANNGPAYHAFHRLIAATDPIAMRLPCERCGQLHIDEGEFATKPHHTHSCQHCGLTWRPAKEHTVGVQFIPGFKNDDMIPPPLPYIGSIESRVGFWGEQRGGEPTSQGLGSQGHEFRLHVFKDGDWARLKDRTPVRIEHANRNGTIELAGGARILSQYLEPWVPHISGEPVRIKSVLGKPLEVPEFGLVVGVEQPHGADTRWCVSLNEGGQRALWLSDLEPHDPTPAACQAQIRKDLGL